MTGPQRIIMRTRETAEAPLAQEERLIAYWEGRIDTAKMVQALKALPTAP